MLDSQHFVNILVDNYETFVNYKGLKGSIETYNIYIGSVGRERIQVILVLPLIVLRFGFGWVGVVQFNIYIRRRI